MYRLLALDIDDTLTKEAESIPKRNMEAIKRAQEAGIFVTVATGRGFCGSTPIWKKLGIEGPVINYSGGVINDTRTGKPIRFNGLSSDTVTEMLNYLHGRGLYCHIYQDEAVITETPTQYGGAYCSFLGIPYREDPELRQKRWENVPKVLAIVEPELAEGIAAEINARYAGVVEAANSKPSFVEINRAGVNKGTALLALAEDLGVKREETVAVGDNTLDLEMIKYAGLGAAVGDAKEPAKAVADIITPDCLDCGVAWLIDEVLLKGR